MIAEINSTSQINTLNTEKSKLETYQAKLVSAQTALGSAEKKYKRQAALWKDDATAKEDLESAQDALAAAKPMLPSQGFNQTEQNLHQYRRVGIGLHAHYRNDGRHGGGDSREEGQM